MLSDAQIAQYQERGYVIPDFRLPESVLADLRADHERLVARHPELRQYCPNLLSYDLRFLEIARTPGIVEMVGQILGPDFCALAFEPVRQARRGRQAHALAPGRPVLAHPSACDLHGLDRARRFDR